MVQLNDKFVDSCEIAEDNSLSYIVKSQINENQKWNISNNNNKKGNEVIPNYKLQSINKNNINTNKNLENIKKQNKLSDKLD